jgi:hypothetical protein
MKDARQNRKSKGKAALDESASSPDTSLTNSLGSKNVETTLVGEKAGCFVIDSSVEDSRERISTKESPLPARRKRSARRIRLCPESPFGLVAFCFWRMKHSKSLICVF